MTMQAAIDGAMRIISAFKTLSMAFALLRISDLNKDHSNFNFGENARGIIDDYLELVASEPAIPMRGNLSFSIIDMKTNTIVETVP